MQQQVAIRPQFANIRIKKQDGLLPRYAKDYRDALINSSNAGTVLRRLQNPDKPFGNTFTNKFVPQLSKTYGGKFGVPMAVHISNQVSKQGSLARSYYNDVGITQQALNKKAQKSRIAQAKTLQLSSQIHGINVNRKQIQQYVPQVVSNLVSAYQGLNTSGFGPISKKGSIFYVGRYIDPKSGKIKVLPKASKKFLDPFSYDQRKRYLQAKIIQNWNQFIKDQQQYNKFIAKDQQTWVNKAFASVQKATTVTKVKYMNKIQGKAKKTNIPAYIVAVTIGQYPDLAIYLSDYRKLKIASQKQTLQDKLELAIVQDISQKIYQVGNRLTNTIQDALIVRMGSTQLMKNDFKRKYRGILQSLRFGSLKSVAGAIKKLGKSLAVPQTNASFQQLQQSKQNIKAFNRQIQYATSIQSANAQSYSTTVSNMIESAKKKARADLATHSSGWKTLFNQGKGDSYYYQNPKIQPYRKFTGFGTRKLIGGNLPKLQNIVVKRLPRVQRYGGILQKDQLEAEEIDGDASNVAQQIQKQAKDKVDRADAPKNTQTKIQSYMAVYEELKALPRQSRNQQVDASMVALGVLIGKPQSQIDVSVNPQIFQNSLTFFLNQIKQTQYQTPQALTQYRQQIVDRINKLKNTTLKYVISSAFKSVFPQLGGMNNVQSLFKTSQVQLNIGTNNPLRRSRIAYNNNFNNNNSEINIPNARIEPIPFVQNQNQDIASRINNMIPVRSKSIIKRQKSLPKMSQSMIRPNSFIPQPIMISKKLQNLINNSRLYDQQWMNTHFDDDIQMANQIALQQQKKKTTEYFQPLYQNIQNSKQLIPLFQNQTYQQMQQQKQQTIFFNNNNNNLDNLLRKSRIIYNTQFNYNQHMQIQQSEIIGNIPIIQTEFIQQNQQQIQNNIINTLQTISVQALNQMALDIQNHAVQQFYNYIRVTTQITQSLNNQNRSVVNNRQQQQQQQQPNIQQLSQQIEELPNQQPQQQQQQQIVRIQQPIVQARVNIIQPLNLFKSKQIVSMFNQKKQYPIIKPIKIQQPIVNINRQIHKIPQMKSDYIRHVNLFQPKPKLSLFQQPLNIQINRETTKLKLASVSNQILIPNVIDQNQFEFPQRPDPPKKQPLFKQVKVTNPMKRLKQQQPQILLVKNQPIIIPPKRKQKPQPKPKQPKIFIPLPQKPIQKKFMQNSYKQKKAQIHLIDNVLKQIQQKPIIQKPSKVKVNTVKQQQKVVQNIKTKVQQKKSYQSPFTIRTNTSVSPINYSQSIRQASMIQQQIQQPIKQVQMQQQQIQDLIKVQKYYGTKFVRRRLDNQIQNIKSKIQNLNLQKIQQQTIKNQKQIKQQQLLDIINQINILRQQYPQQIKIHHKRIQNLYLALKMIRQQKTKNAGLIIIKASRLIDNVILFKKGLKKMNDQYNQISQQYDKFPLLKKFFLITSHVQSQSIMQRFNISKQKSVLNRYQYLMTKVKQTIDKHIQKINYIKDDQYYYATNAIFLYKKIWNNFQSPFNRDNDDQIQRKISQHIQFNTKAITSLNQKIQKIFKNNHITFQQLQKNVQQLSSQIFISRIVKISVYQYIYRKWGVLYLRNESFRPNLNHYLTLTYNQYYQNQKLFRNGKVYKKDRYYQQAKKQFQQQIMKLQSQFFIYDKITQRFFKLHNELIQKLRQGYLKRKQFMKNSQIRHTIYQFPFNRQFYSSQIFLTNKQKRTVQSGMQTFLTSIKKQKYNLIVNELKKDKISFTNILQLKKQALSQQVIKQFFKQQNVINTIMHKTQIRKTVLIQQIIKKRMGTKNLFWSNVYQKPQLRLKNFFYSDKQVKLFHILYQKHKFRFINQTNLNLFNKYFTFDSYFSKIKNNVLTQIIFPINNLKPIQQQLIVLFGNDKQYLKLHNRLKSLPSSQFFFDGSINYNINTQGVQNGITFLEPFYMNYVFNQYRQDELRLIQISNSTGYNQIISRTKYAQPILVMHLQIAIVSFIQSYINSQYQKQIFLKYEPIILGYKKVSQVYTQVIQMLVNQVFRFATQLFYQLITSLQITSISFLSIQTPVLLQSLYETYYQMTPNQSRRKTQFGQLMSASLLLTMRIGMRKIIQYNLQHFYKYNSTIQQFPKSQQGVKIMKIIFILYKTQFTYLSVFSEKTHLKLISLKFQQKPIMNNIQQLMKVKHIRQYALNQQEIARLTDQYIQKQKQQNVMINNRQDNSSNLSSLRRSTRSKSLFN